MTATPSALFNERLERDVLGQCLIGGYPQYEPLGLEAECFARDAHQRVWRAIVATADTGADPNLTTVGVRLIERGDLETVGAGYLAGLVDGQVTPSAADALVLAAKLGELAAGRLVHYATVQLAERLKAPGAVADGALVQHLDTVQAIVERRRVASAAPWLSVEAQLQAHHDEVRIATGQRVYLGLPALDEAIGGVTGGEVCGLMGRPGIGKTVFLSHITRSAAEQVGHVFFSLEMPGGQIVGRLKQMVYRLGRHAVEERTRQGLIDGELYRGIFQSLVIVDTPSLSVAEMGRRLRQIQAGPLRHVPIRLITIDHLGLIGGDRSLSTYDRVSTQAREIKDLAKRTNAAVLLAVQVNRDAGGDGSRELGLGSARDSGVVEEAMDYLIGIRRLDRSLTLATYERERYKDVIFAKVIKNRHGDPQLDEVAYRFSPWGLSLTEDKDLRPDATDLARFAAPRGGRR